MSMQEYRHIIRIAGSDVDGQESLLQGLTRIKGVGIRLSKAIITKLGLNPTLRLGFLDDATIERIETLLQDLVGEGFPWWYVNRPRDRITGKMVHLTGADLEFIHKSDIERLKRIRAWRGVRHALNLKVRGQRTRTTGRRYATVGVSRKKS